MKYFIFLIITTVYFVIKVHPLKAQSFELVITEIMADPDPPAGNLPNAEYVEIYNRSSQAVNLTGWILYDGSSRVLPAKVIQAGDYLILCANADTLSFMPHGFVAGVTSLSLTNTGEKIALRNTQGFTVDSVIYSDLWFGDSFKSDGGWSLERIDSDFTCMNVLNWQPSEAGNGGTPGIENSVNGVFKDPAPPSLIHAFCPDSITVTLVFNEALDTGAASNILWYQPQGSQSVLSACFAEASLLRINLTLLVPVVKGVVYEMVVDSISDCSGNRMPSSMVRFGIPDSTGANGIIINEVLFDPFTNGYDFIELYHYGTGIVDLMKLKVASTDPDSGEIISLSNLTDQTRLMFPGDYIILTEKPEVVAEQYRTPYPFYFLEMATLPAMNVDRGRIALMQDQALLDEMRYEDDYHFPLLQSTDGISLEKIHPARKPMETTSWHSCALSAGGATPGFRNSVYDESPGMDRTVSVHPEIFSPDGDGFDDVITFQLRPGEAGNIGNITITNREGRPIYDHRKNTLLALSDSFSWDGITSEGVLAPPGIYVALIEIVSLEGKVKHFKIPLVLAIKL